MGRKPKTEQQRSEEARRRARSIWAKQWDYGLRNCVEFALSVYLVGFLPLIMHWIVSMFAPPQTDWRWVRAEAWLFVMVTSAAALGDSWRERRRNDGVLTLVFALFGGLGSCTGALAYAMLMLQPVNAAGVTAGFGRTVWWVVWIVGILFFLMRLPLLVQNAREEAESKATKESRGAPQKGTAKT